MTDIPASELRDYVCSLNSEAFERLQDAVNERKCREEFGYGTLAEAASFYIADIPACPVCHTNAKSIKDGLTAKGIARFRCKGCNMRYNALTNTVLSCCKKDLYTWILFIKLMCWNNPLDEISELCHITHKTAFEWRHRVFATVDNYQDRIILQGQIWIDETYISDMTIVRNPLEHKRRGLSSDLICIAVGIDHYKNLVAKVCGNGKPSAKRLKQSMLGHIAPGSVVYHDKERAHGSLLKAAKCQSKTFKADITDPIYLESMALINDFCAWLKRYIRKFPGMGKEYLQSYLNWYVYLYRIKQADEKWPKVGRVVRHLILCEKEYSTS